MEWGRQPDSDLMLTHLSSLPPHQMWRVYQRGLERWIIDMLQPLLDSLVKDGLVPRFVQVCGGGGRMRYNYSNCLEGSEGAELVRRGDLHLLPFHPVILLPSAP